VCIKFCKFFHGMTGKLKQLAAENGPTQNSSEVASWVFHEATSSIKAFFFISVSKRISRDLFASIQFSCVSTASALIKRSQLSSLGNILTTKVRRLISSLSRSNMLFDFMCL